jgi:hypothetical protein
MGDSWDDDAVDPGLEVPGTRLDLARKVGLLFDHVEQEPRFDAEPSPDSFFRSMVGEQTDRNRLLVEAGSATVGRQPRWQLGQVAERAIEGSPQATHSTLFGKDPGATREGRAMT